MSKLEDLLPNASAGGILPNRLVTVVSAQRFGSEALELTYKDLAGKLANELLYRHDEPRLEVAVEGRPWSFAGDGHQFRLVSEAHRIRLAHLFDTVLAVHTSVVEPACSDPSNAASSPNACSMSRSTAPGTTRHHHYAPYLDYRPLRPEEPDVTALSARPECAWIARDLERQAQYTRSPMWCPRISTRCAHSGSS